MKSISSRIFAPTEKLDNTVPRNSGAFRNQFTAILTGAALYVLFVEMYSSTVADYDLWGYLAFGRAFWETGFPYRDLFSYTPTNPLWVYHEWLTGVLFYSVYRHAGEAGLQLLRYALILVTLYLIYRTALRRGGTPLSACFALVPAMLLMCYGYVPVRAQVFTYLFSILTIYILETFRSKQRWHVLFWLTPLMVLWCNLHGGFIAGLGLIGLYAAGEGLSGRSYIPLIGAGILAAAATVVNPYGIHYWSYTFSAVTMPRPDIDEWVSVIGAIKRGLYLLPAYLFTSMALLCAAGCLVRRHKDYADILVTAAIIVVGASHIRHTVFMGLIFGAYLPALLAEQWHSARRNRAFLRNRAWIPGAVFASLLLLIHLSIGPVRIPALVPSFRIETPLSKYPLGAMNWIMERDVRANILPLFHWGEFIIWYLSPQCRVAMDGRYETVYPDHVHREYFDFLFARPAWREFLHKYPHDMVLLRAGMQIAELMRGEADWRIAYGDRESVLFVRNREQPR
ncbi:MAG: hypothetical protein ACYC7J_02500 [Syntrophales bacterium]